MIMAGRYTFPTLAAVWTLLQGLINVAFSIVGFLIYSCEIDLHTEAIQDRLNYLLYMAYFHSSTCATTLRFGTGTATFTQTPFTVTRNRNFMIVYMAVGSAWVLTSLLLLSGIANKVRGSSCYIFVTPWVIIGTLAVFADIIAGATFVADIPQTLTLQQLMDYIGATDAQLGNEDRDNAWVASLLVAGYYSRFLVLWILNIVIIIMVVNTMKTNATPSTSTSSQHHFADSGNDPAEINSLWANGNVAHHLPKVEPPFHMRVWKEINVHMRTPSPRTEDEYAKRPRTEEDFNRVIAQFRNEIGSDTSPPSSAHVVPSNYQRTSSYVSPKAASNNQSANSSASSTTPAFLNNEQRNQPELLGQLPWSYVSGVQANSGQVAPNRMRDQLPEDEDLPPVPVPDYTLHHPKRSRINAVKRDSSKASNGDRPVIKNMGESSKDWRRSDVLY